MHPTYYRKITFLLFYGMPEDCRQLSEGKESILPKLVDNPEMINCERPCSVPTSTAISHTVLRGPATIRLRTVPIFAGPKHPHLSFYTHYVMQAVNLEIKI